MFYSNKNNNKTVANGNWLEVGGWRLDDDAEDDRPQYEDNLIIDNQLWEFKWTL